jgi:hypothetical protein
MQWCSNRDVKPWIRDLVRGQNREESGVRPGEMVPVEPLSKHALEAHDERLHLYEPSTGMESARQISRNSLTADMNAFIMRAERKRLL